MGVLKSFDLKKVKVILYLTKLVLAIEVRVVLANPVILED